ncbi:hypothetical protein [Sphingomicrobium lutaoense]|uniref:Uncharacterized protein n=1 Tax=Sphingomicrobium lutaoense TaxID=515949 RepID=A0A839Z2E7_9SPHN|nr:hypothetical protein [Sphingomicrobium lutaoense]MBB3764728.1 hypothetical protein [Sphingomicrobium lutaoense]
MIALAGLLLAGQAAEPATSARPDDQDAIVIRGTLPETQSEMVREMVRALAPGSVRDTVPRFHDPLCPFVVGLPEESASLVTTRMRAVAEAVGLGAAKPDCKANLLLVVASEREPLFKHWRKNHPDIFFGREPADIRRLRDTEGPIVSWQIIQPADRNLDPLPRDIITGVTYNESSEDPLRLRVATRPDVRASVVVVDSEAVDGISTYQLADHVLMSALAPMRRSAAEDLDAPTILHLFREIDSEQGAVQSVTAWDFAFLRAMHSTENTAYAASFRSEVQAKMEDELSRRSAEELEE